MPRTKYHEETLDNDWECPKCHSNNFDVIDVYDENDYKDYYCRCYACNQEFIVNYSIIYNCHTWEEEIPLDKQTLWDNKD